MSQPHRERERSETAARPVPVRAERYLVAPVPRPQFSEPTEAQRVIDALADDPEVRVLRVIQPQARGSGAATPVAVVETAPDHAARLAASPQYYIEADHPLRYGTDALRYADPGVTPLHDTVEVSVAVEGPDGGPLSGAAVYVLAEQYPAHAVTRDDGRATLTIAAHEVESIAGVYVQPRFDHWSGWLGRPRITAGEPIRVVCDRLEPMAAENWSRRAMGFDRLPPTFRGHGVRIAIVDSGMSTGHDELADRVLGGRDLVNQDEKSWQEDVAGFGTVAAGLIAATQDRTAVTGLAPEADLQICKVFPGGHFGDLIEALDYCITAEVDIIDLGLGSPYLSSLVAQKIEEARQAGIACIAATGSGTGPVAFPASLPTVLAVAAIGKLGTFPPGSYHATQLASTPTPEGYFSARFSGYGPEIDVCAPGVAVVSTVPPSNRGALDGTAAAAAHIAALAGLVLAHHPDFRDGYRIRGAARVDRLFGILRASCRPLPFQDRLRVGAGLPDAVAAVGLAPPPAYAAAATMPAVPWIAFVPAQFAGVGAVTGTEPTAGPSRGLADLRAAMYSAGLTPDRTPPEQHSGE